MAGGLLEVLGYTWAIFGAYWIVLARVATASHEGEAQSTARRRLAILAVTFVLLLFFARKVPPFAVLVLSIAWSALGLHWATPEASSSGEFRFYRVLRLGILAITFSLLFWDRTAVGFLGKRFMPPVSAVAIAGFVAVIAGLSITVWARVHLAQYWSDKVVLQTGHQLVRSGPYAYMRHPIYSGVLLGAAGTALVLGQWRGVLAFAILLINYWIKAKKEERLLAERFGAEFQTHRAHTGFLLPRLP